MPQPALVKYRFVPSPAAPCRRRGGHTPCCSWCRATPCRPGPRLHRTSREQNQGWKPEVEAPAGRCREWRPAVLDPDRSPVRHRRPLRRHGGELRPLVPRELIGVSPARDQHPAGGARLDPRPGDPDTVLADELDRLAGAAAARKRQRRLRVDAVRATLHEDGATGRHAGAPDQADGARQRARTLRGAEAGGAAVRADIVACR